MPREEMVIATGAQRHLKRVRRELQPVVMTDSVLDLDKWGLWITTCDMAEDLRRIEEHETR